MQDDISGMKIFFFLVLALALFFGAHAEEVMLKKITHRGGVVEFSIPAHWKAESENEGGMFYEDSPESGTLRLTVMTFRHPASIKEKSALEFLRSLKQAESRRVESLTNGNALLHYTEPTTEADQKLCMTYWIVANLAASNHVRLATFSFALKEGQQQQQRFKKELSLIDSQVRKATFSKEVGETSSK